MRKLLFPLIALAAFTLSLGCHHVAGRCDCDGPDDHCRFNHYPGTPNTDPIPVMPPSKAPEKLKEAPVEKK